VIERASPPANGPACGPLDHCVTCSDEGLPMRVLEIDAADGLAVCRGEDGGESTIDVQLIGDVAPGETLLVHAGVALALLEEARG
jgi:hydrogenase maturation factor